MGDINPLDIIQGAGSLLPALQSGIDRMRARWDPGRRLALAELIRQFNEAQAGYGGMFGTREDGTPLSAREGYASYLAGFLSNPDASQQGVAGLATLANSMSNSPAYQSWVPGHVGETLDVGRVPEFAMPQSMAGNAPPGVVNAIQPWQPDVQMPDWSNAPAPEPIRRAQTIADRFENWRSGDRQTVGDILDRITANMETRQNARSERRGRRQSDVSALPGYARGTPSAIGGWSVVGEGGGPELVNLRPNTPVVPLGKAGNVPSNTPFGVPSGQPDSFAQPRSPIYGQLSQNPSGMNPALQNAMYSRQENLINNQYQEFVRQQREQGAAAGQLGSGNFQRRMSDVGQQRIQELAGARQNIDIAAQQNAFQNLLQSAGLEESRQLGFGNLALGQGQLGLSRELGMGNLALGQGQLSLQGELGRGQLGLQQEQAQRGYGFTQQQLDILRQENERANVLNIGTLGQTENAFRQATLNQNREWATNLYMTMIQAGQTHEQAIAAIQQQLASAQDPNAFLTTYGGAQV